MDNPGAIATAAPRPNWRSEVASFRSGQHTHSRLLGGSLIMLIGSAVVSLLNFSYNVAVARLLGPAGFGHAAVAVTLLMFVSGVTLSFQLVCAKLVARNEIGEVKAALYSRLLRNAWIVGLAIGAGLAAAAGPVADYLNLPSPWMVAVLAFGFAFYVPLGARRGGMQGMCAFRRLASSYVSEALLKLLAAVLLVEAGFGAMGAIAAISASVVLAYFLPVPRELKLRTGMVLPASFHEALQAVVFFVGQVVISNTDIILVKHFFTPATAGLYAAVALVGRLVYFASWMVVSAMFPISAGAKQEERRPAILAVPIAFVVAISGSFVALLALFPHFLLNIVFGVSFAGAGVESLLPLYAGVAGVYSLSVVLIAYEMSRRIANTGWWQLAVSAAMVAGIYLFHSSLREVVLVQLVLMIALLGVVSLPFLRRTPAPVAQEEAA